MWRARWDSNPRLPDLKSHREWPNCYDFRSPWRMTRSSRPAIPLLRQPFVRHSRKPWSSLTDINSAQTGFEVGLYSRSTLLALRSPSKAA